MLSALFASFHLEASWTPRFLLVQETVYHCWAHSRSVLYEVCPCLYEFCFKCWLWPWPKLGMCRIPAGVLSPCRNMASKIPPDVPSPCRNMVGRDPPGIQSSFWNMASRIFPGSRKNLQTAPHSNHWVEIWSEPACTETQVPSHIPDFRHGQDQHLRQCIHSVYLLSYVYIFVHSLFLLPSLWAQCEGTAHCYGKMWRQEQQEACHGMSTDRMQNDTIPCWFLFLSETKSYSLAHAGLEFVTYPGWPACLPGIRYIPSMACKPLLYTRMLWNFSYIPRMARNLFWSSCLSLSYAYIMIIQIQMNILNLKTWFHGK